MKKMKRYRNGTFKGADGVLMHTYRAIPYPIPEPWRTELVKLGKVCGEDADNDIPALLRLEANMRELLGVSITRQVMFRPSQSSE